MMTTRFCSSCDACVGSEGPFFTSIAEGSTLIVLWPIGIASGLDNFLRGPGVDVDNGLYQIVDDGRAIVLAGYLDLS